MPKTKTQITVDLFDKYAQIYQEKFMDISRYHDLLNLFCKQITKENPDILDLACGPGNISQYLLQKRPDFQILGSDLSPKMIVLAQANNPSAAFQIMDCREVHQLKKKYHGICCGFGLPYLSKLETQQFITDCAAQLNPKGLLYLSTMEGDYGQSGFQGSSTDKNDKVFIHYHQEDYLRYFLLEAGYNILELQYHLYENDKKEGVRDLVILAQLEN